MCIQQEFFGLNRKLAHNLTFKEILPDWDNPYFGIAILNFTLYVEGYYCKSFPRNFFTDFFQRPKLSIMCLILATVIGYLNHLVRSYTSDFIVLCSRVCYLQA